MKNVKGITLISLVITIIVLIILASIGIYLSLGNNGIFTRAKEAKETTNKQQATDIINLKITTAQMNKYAEKQRMPTLKELSEALIDDEIQYVTEESQVASTTYKVGENPSSIYTKLYKYPYEFEINSSLQLASINGIKIATNTVNNKAYSIEKLGETVGTNKIDINANLYDEIYIDIIYIDNNSKSPIHTAYTVKTFTITDDLEVHNILGEYSVGQYANINISSTQIQLGAIANGSTIYTQSARFNVWGIKY